MYHVDDRQLHDLFTCVHALKYTGIKLEPYTKSKLQEVHQLIYRKLANLPPCVNQCSSKGIKRWCATCSEWKTELSKFIKRPRGVDWVKLESWQWPVSPDNIAPVFLSHGTVGSANNRIILSDLSAACKIWDNCKQVNVKTIYLKNVLRVRNDTFHKQAVTQTDKARVFDALMDLIRDPDFKATIDTNVYLNELNEIKNGYQISKEKIKTFIRNKHGEDMLTLSIAEAVNDITILANDICNKLESGNGMDRILSRMSRLERWFIYLCSCLLVGVLVFMLDKTSTNSPTYTQRITRESEQGCISEEYSYPFRQDLPLIGYLKHHSKLVGRKWLIDHIESSLLTNKSSQGIIMSADFGFGKSAIVSHLLCAEKNETGYKFREQVVAFHVCKFDVPSTKSPERFLRRLVGFFSTKSAEYGSIISIISDDSILYNKDECGKEIEACFDQAVTFPFQEIQTHGGIWLIVIDALDECYDSNENKNVIFELLSSRLQYFPIWVKFLITTRHISRLNEFKKVDFQSLSLQDPNNLEDIRSYVIKSYESKMKTVSNTTVGKLIQKSEGNFLYVFHTLPYILNYNNETDIDIPELPEKLQDIYEINFDRQFNKGKSYGVCKMILEIICTTLNPLTKDEIFKILADNLFVDNSFLRFESEFTKLSFFLNSGDRVNFKHRAIHSWLLNEPNEIYRISPKIGHDLISKHILNNLKYNKTGNIVELVIHLAETGNEELLNMYGLINISDTLNFNPSSVLHDLVDRSSSADALGLLLQKHSNIDILGRYNMTATFLAASKGHLDQIRLLHGKGADINFGVPGCKCTEIDTYVIDEEDIKTRSYIGYTVLHIAVQNNFFNVVKFIIDETDVILYKTNSVGMRPIDIACENGYSDILTTIHGRDKHILDDQCLYFATKNRQIIIVNYVITTGFLAGCITRTRAEMELKSITRRCNCDVSSSDMKLESIHRQWIVRQETSLHIAIRLGFDDLAELLVHNQKQLLKCSDAFGYIPQLLAFKYNRTILLSKLFESELGLCLRSGNHMQNIDNKNIPFIRWFKLREETCPEGANLAHLMTIYNKTNLMKMLNLSAFEWNTRDFKGNLPVHYAACHSITFLAFFKNRFGRRIFLERSMNGSSVYHLAALCHNDGSLVEMTNNYSENLTDFALNNVIDENHRTILHYYVLSERQITPEDYYENATYFKMIKYFSKYINETAVDIFGNNVFHYIFKNGLIKEFVLLNYTLKPFDVKRAALETKNKDGLSAAEYALKHAVPGTYFVTTQSLADLKANALPVSDTHKYEYLWESCLINFFVGSLTQNEIVDFAGRYIDVVILKGPYFTKYFFDIFKIINFEPPNKTSFRHLIVRGMKVSKVDRKYAFPWISLYSISSSYASILQVCGSPLDSSPLHYIVLNSLSYSLSVADFNTVNIALEKTKTSETFTCCTMEGYNLLHYAIIGGNIDLALRLENEGLRLITKYVSASDILFMLNCVRFKPGLDQHSKIDNFLENFIAQNENLLTVDDFCTNRSQSLSLIHILAINGMIKTMDEIAKIFGNDIFRCVNVNGFSSRYFAVLFQRVDMENYFMTRNISYGIPNPNAEELLLINMKNKFSLTRYNSVLSRLVTSPRPVHMIDSRLLMKTYRYLSALFRSQYISFQLNDVFSYNLIYFWQGLYLFRKLFLRTHVLRINVKKNFTGGHLNHWVNSNLLKSVQSDLQNLRHWSEIRHRTLSWTHEYPFLDNINRILQLPEMNNYLNRDVHDTCDTNSAWHMLFYLEKVFKVFTTNIQNIIVLLNLLDQKALIKADDYPITFLGFKDGCSRFPSQLTTGAVYEIGRLRYLNQIKSTLAYKEILSRMDYSKPQEESDDYLENEITFMNNMINNTKKRVRWIARNFKCEVLPFLPIGSESNWMKAKREDS